MKRNKKLVRRLFSEKELRNFKILEYQENKLMGMLNKKEKIVEKVAKK
jgi:hypothetical protein